MRSSVGFAGDGGWSRRSFRVGVVFVEAVGEVVVGLGVVDVVEVVAGFAVLLLLVVVDW